MPQILHPLLEQDAQAAAAAEAPSAEPEAVTELAPVEAPDEGAASETPADEDYFIKIDTRNLYQELQRLDRDNEAFRTNFRTFTGRTAKRQYEPQIETLRAENEALRLAQRQQLIREMPAQDIETRFASDPEFAREYAEAIHAQPIDLAARNEQIAWQSAIEDVFDAGLNAGLPPNRVEDYRAALAQGHFDAEGLSIPQQFARMQATMNNEIAEMRTAKAQVQATPPVQVAAPTTPQATPATRVNPALAEATPDLSTARTNASTGTMTMSEVKNMSRQEKMARWPNYGDFDADVAAGKIIRD